MTLVPRTEWLFFATLLSGCLTPDETFHCTTQQACVDEEGGAGVCEPSGFCSFADPSCASGRRYGQFAGDGLARQCVGEDMGVPDFGDHDIAGIDFAGGDLSSTDFASCADDMKDGNETD